jgi:hypothetical protein
MLSPARVYQAEFVLSDAADLYSAVGMSDFP